MEQKLSHKRLLPLLGEGSWNPIPLQLKQRSWDKLNKDSHALEILSFGVHYFSGFPGVSDGKESVCNAGDPGLILGQEDPLEKGMAIYSRGQVGYSLWDHEEWDKTE